MPFGPWRPLDGLTPPSGPGLLQARLDQGAAGLLDYPRGRSAMVYYDGDDDDLVAAVGRLRARAAGAEHRVYVRFAPPPQEPPSAAAARLREAFRHRFGAPPRWNAPT